MSFYSFHSSHIWCTIGVTEERIQNDHDGIDLIHKKLQHGLIQYLLV